MGQHRFQPGNPGGPGRPPKDKENAYLDAMRKHFTPEQVVEVIQSLLNDGASWRARHAGAELLLHYALGKPTQRIQHAGANTPEEWVQALLGQQDEVE